MDYIDVEFLALATALYSFKLDIIIGSKNLFLSSDFRPVLRRVVSQTFRIALTAGFGLRVSDTHGIKAWRNTPAFTAALAACGPSQHMFDTELILRLQRRGARIIEIPVTVAEQRVGAAHILRRVPKAVSEMVRLWWALRAERRKSS